MQMRALVVEEPNKFAIEKIALPTIDRDSVLVRVHGCTICGSDLKLLRGDMAGVDFPLVPGHEWSGVVVDAGANWSNLHGNNVVADVLQSCGKCTACKRHQRNLCDSLIEPGLTAQGAYAEYISVPGSSVRILPEGLDLTTACLVEPLSVVLYAIERQPPHPDDRVLVIGGGGIGLLLVASLRARGVERILVIDPHIDRRTQAVRLGAGASSVFDADARDALGGDPDLVYNAASQSSGFLDAIQHCRAGGRVGLIGYSGFETVNLCPSDLVVKLLDVRGALSPTYDWVVAANKLANGQIRCDGIVSHVVPLDNFRQAFSLAGERRDGAIRVMVSPA